MKIVSVDMRVTPMSGSWLTEKVIANPMSPFPEYAERRSSWYGTMTSGLVSITVEDGTVGHGFVGGGRANAGATLIDDQFRSLLVGKDCFSTEALFDHLTRASAFYGHGGIPMAVISGIDIALWDLKGKLLERPVYDLLGGKGTPHLSPYLTSWNPHAIEEFGIHDVKIAVPYGPAHGEAGMRANEAVVAEARELIGDDGFIALDCYMAWSAPYAREMMRRLESYQIAWIEEPVMPEDIEGYRRVGEVVNCRVSGGEHSFTLPQFERLITEGRIDLVQPDIYRAGGITGLRRIASLARAHNVDLICHGVGSPTYHFLISNGPVLSPRCEYLDIYDGGSAIWVLSDDPRPADGQLVLSDAPGFGYDINPDAFLDGATVAPIW
ncbi:MAG: enolase C-terminal domain-like protein [Microcella sp.]|uniref:enolase C-terminal domain-like protein n=1 Tax=Microcella sp. TaxID=1913979 RepID=UPI0033146792